MVVEEVVVMEDGGGCRQREVEDFGTEVMDDYFFIGRTKPVSDWQLYHSFLHVRTSIYVGLYINTKYWNFASLVCFVLCRRSG